jgi:hypothetical protein
VQDGHASRPIQRVGFSSWCWSKNRCDAAGQGQHHSMDRSVSAQVTNGLDVAVGGGQNRPGGRFAQVAQQAPNGCVAAASAARSDGRSRTLPVNPAAWMPSADSVAARVSSLAWVREMSAIWKPSRPSRRAMDRPSPGAGSDDGKDGQAEHQPRAARGPLRRANSASRSALPSWSLVTAGTAPCQRPRMSSRIARAARI